MDNKSESTARPTQGEQSASENNATEDVSYDTESTVELHEATDAEIDAFLENAKNASKDAEDSREANRFEPSGDDEELKEDTSENNSEEETPSENKSDITKEQLLAKLSQQENYIKQRNQEIGNLRKQLVEANEQLKTTYAEVVNENPEKALELQNQFKENAETIKSIDFEAVENERRMQSQKLLVHYVHPDNWDVSSLAKTWRARGLPEQFVSKFEKDPLSVRPDVLIEGFERIRAEKAVVQLVKYVEHLKKELETAQQKPKKVLNQVKKALKDSPVMKPGNGGVTVNDAKSFSRKDLTKLSDKELDDFISSRLSA